MDDTTAHATATLDEMLDEEMLDEEMLDDEEMLVEEISIDGMCGVY